MTDTDRLPELDERLIRSRLQRTRFARLGYVDDDGPVIVPINVIIDDDERVVFHTNPTSALAALDGQHVAIEIDGFDPASRSGWSILVRGVARDVTASSDVVAMKAKVAPVDSWAPGVRNRTFVVLALAITGRTIPMGADGDWFAGVPAS